MGTSKPITGFRGSIFTSATGLYTQLMPANLTSRAEASDMRSARSGEPVAASAIAPGLQSCRQFLSSESGILCNGQLGAGFIAVGNAKGRDGTYGKYRLAGLPKSLRIDGPFS